MSLINNCQFIGRLGEDPKIISFSMDKEMAKLSIAVSLKYKDKEGNDAEKTTWVSLVCFKPGLVRILSEYYHKGDLALFSCEYAPTNYPKEGKTFYNHDFAIMEVRKLSFNESGTKREQIETSEHKEDDDLPF